MTNLGNVKNGLMINLIPNNNKLKNRMKSIKKNLRNNKINICDIIFYRLLDFRNLLNIKSICKR